MDELGKGDSWCRYLTDEYIVKQKLIILVQIALVILRCIDVKDARKRNRGGGAHNCIYTVS